MTRKYDEAINRGYRADEPSVRRREPVAAVKVVARAACNNGSGHMVGLVCLFTAHRTASGWVEEPVNTPRVHPLLGAPVRLITAHRATRSSTVLIAEPVERKGSSAAAAFLDAY